MRAEAETAAPRHSEPPISVSPAPPDLAKLQQELAAQQDEFLHLAADFENYKKRTRRDSEQQAAAQKEVFISDLLPALDNLERALAAPSSTAAQLQQGVTLTLQQLSQLLHQHGIEPMAAVGCPFDPHRHAAISVRHDSSQPDQIVLEVAQRGYCCGDRVFRPAQVIVNDLSHSPGVSHASQV